MKGTSMTTTHMPVRSSWFGRTTSLEGRWITAGAAGQPAAGCSARWRLRRPLFRCARLFTAHPGQRRGFPVVALTRPGYPADEDSARRQPSFAAAASIIADAVSDVWDHSGGPARAIVLWGIRSVRQWRCIWRPRSLPGRYWGWPFPASATWSHQ